MRQRPGHRGAKIASRLDVCVGMIMASGSRAPKMAYLITRIIEKVDRRDTGVIVRERRLRVYGLQIHGTDQHGIIEERDMDFSTMMYMFPYILHRPPPEATTSPVPPSEALR